MKLQSFKRKDQDPNIIKSLIHCISPGMIKNRQSEQHLNPYPGFELPLPLHLLEEEDLEGVEGTNRIYRDIPKFAHFNPFLPF